MLLASSYSCKDCVLNEMPNRVPGRYCFFSLNNDYLDIEPVEKFDVSSRIGFDKSVVDEESFYKAIEDIREKTGIDDIGSVLRFIGKGLCPKSFPATITTKKLIELVSYCSGGESGTDLIRLPYDNLSLFDNPIIFLHAFNIINLERNKWLKERDKEIKNNKHGNGKRI